MNLDDVCKNLNYQYKELSLIEQEKIDRINDTYNKYKAIRNSYKLNNYDDLLINLYIAKKKY